jgi:hypothetical protein
MMVLRTLGILRVSILTKLNSNFKLEFMQILFKLKCLHYATGPEMCEC